MRASVGAVSVPDLDREYIDENKEEKNERDANSFFRRALANPW